MKNKNEIIALWIVTAIVMIIVVVPFIVNNNRAKANLDNLSSSNLVLSDNNFDFGTISMGDGKVSHRFSIKNEGAELAVINKLYTSCMCTVVAPLNKDGKKNDIFGMQGNRSVAIEIKPGETIDLEAIFDPAAHGPSGVGLAQRVIYVETNSTESSRLEYSFQAVVTK